MESIVIEMKSTSILSGFIAVSAMSAFPTVCGFVGENARTATAPMRVTIQYVSISNLKSLILGKNSMENIIIITVIMLRITGKTIKKYLGSVVFLLCE